MKKNGARNNDNIMTLREVAQYLGLHVMTVYKLTREGRVPAAEDRRAMAFQAGRVGRVA